MRYLVPPDDVVMDLLSEFEYDNLPNDRARLMKGRAKAWALHRASGPTNRLRTLTQGAAGDSTLFTEYTRTGQLSALIAIISIDEGVQFTSRIERSLIDGSVIGVRVTLVGFTR